jgi:hypothetical protein
MGFGPDDYAARAEECLRLAGLSKDEMIQRELLQLRQLYLATRERLLTQAKRKPNS